MSKEFDFYTSSAGDRVALEDCHSAHLVAIANKMEREEGDLDRVAHIRAVAHSKERRWHDTEPEAYRTWAEKNPEKHADFQARHFGKGGR